MRNRPKKSLFEKLCLITMIASYGVTVIHKVVTNTEYFLLQASDEKEGKGEREN